MCTDRHPITFIELADIYSMCVRIPAPGIYNICVMQSREGGDIGLFITLVSKVL